MECYSEEIKVASTIEKEEKRKLFIGTTNANEDTVVNDRVLSGIGVSTVNLIMETLKCQRIKKEIENKKVESLFEMVEQDLVDERPLLHCKETCTVYPEPRKNIRATTAF